MRIFSTGFSDGFDGPGRRLVVYLKGCNFKCRWCANPESIHSFKEMLFYPGRANVSSNVCPFGAISETGARDREVCKKCDQYSCVRVWKHKAFELAGEDVSPQWVLEQAIRDKPLFGKKGGVTFGGGEPTLQADELIQTLELLKTNGIHTAIETNATSKQFDAFIDRVDWLICDLKCVDAIRHKEWTGLGNETLLQNIKEAANRRKQLVVRIPLVTGFNDAVSEKKQIADFLASLGCDGLTVEILRLHHLGKCKYEALGLEYWMNGVVEPDVASAQNFINELRAKGLCATLG
jgi:pyruvate formate lyase activating enzyme